MSSNMILKIPSKILGEKIPLTAKVVFAYYNLRFKQDDMDTCCDSDKYMAKQLTTKAKNINKAIKILKGLGLITITHHGIIRVVKFTKDGNKELKHAIQIPVLNNLLSLPLKPPSQLIFGYILAYCKKHQKMDISDNLYHQGAFLGLKHNVIKKSLHKLQGHKYITIDNGMLTPNKYLNNTSRKLRWKYRLKSWFYFNKTIKASKER